MLNIYQEFVRNHQYSLQVLANCKQNRDFDKLLKQYESNAACEGRMLETFLTYPMFQVLLTSLTSTDEQKAALSPELCVTGVCFLACFRFLDTSSPSTSCWHTRRTNTWSERVWNSPNPNWRSCRSECERVSEMCVLTGGGNDANDDWSRLSG